VCTLLAGNAGLPVLVVVHVYIAVCVVNHCIMLALDSCACIAILTTGMQAAAFKIVCTLLAGWGL
jgi:hypothetical protein